MKKIVFVILSIIILQNLSFANRQHVHQYFTKEAYYLLRDYLNTDIPVMLTHLDNEPVGPPWTNGTLLAGAWREDNEDVDYLYRFTNSGIINYR